MTPDAASILDVFRAHGLRQGGKIRPTGFGDAIVWESGFVRDESVRQAIAWLMASGYLIEHGAAFELTQAGEQYLYPASHLKHGARVYGLGDVLLVKQTVLRGSPQAYVIDEHRERHVDIADDAAIATAIRDAVNGLM